MSNPFRRLNGHRPHLISRLVDHTPTFYERLRCLFGNHVYRIDATDYYSVSTHCYVCGRPSSRS